MKTAIITLASLLCIIVAAVGALFVWEHRSKLALEGQVEAYLGDCSIDASGIDVHGRPYILFAMRDSVDLTYVDLPLHDGTNKDQLLVHRLSDGRSDRLTRFVSFEHPEGDVDPIKSADGSFTDAAMVDGEHVVYAADVADQQLQLSAAGSRTGAIDLQQDAEVKGTAVTDDGVVVEIEYTDPDCSSAA